MFILHKQIIIQRRLHFELNNEIIHLTIGTSFDIFCQQEVNRIYNWFHKVQQVTCVRGIGQSVFRSMRVYNNNYPVNEI